MTVRVGGLMKAPLAAVAVLITTGCVVAAAGAGAGGGVYFTQRGVESLVAAPVDRASAATEQAFQQLGIRQTKTAVEKQEGQDKREIDGAATDREVAVTLTSAAQGSTRVQVVAKKSAVTWDKDFARSILEKIVALAK